METPNTDQSQATVVRGRAEWLDLLHKCQNGEVTCLFVLKKIEAEMERENARLRDDCLRMARALGIEKQYKCLLPNVKDELADSVARDVQQHSP